MATLAQIQTKIYKLTGTDSNSYPNSEMLIDLNLSLQNIVGSILDSQDESDYDDPRNTDYPIYTFPLTTNRDYSIGQSYGVLKIKDLSVSYDGANYYRATPMDVANMDLGNAPSSATTQNATIDAQFPISSPAYDYKYGSIFLYPKATQAQVDAGAAAVVEFFRQPVEFTSGELTAGTVIPGIDNTFHMMLAYGAAFEYCLPKQLPQLKVIAEKLAMYEDRLRKHYSSKQLDRKYRIGMSSTNYK